MLLSDECDVPSYHLSPDSEHPTKHKLKTKRQEVEETWIKWLYLDV